VRESVLDRIVDSVRARLAVEPPPPDLRRRAAEIAAARRDHRGLFDALAADGPSILAECKHASPSAGVLREPFDPVALATAYAAGGAAAISVVVERDHFRGDPSWIPEVRRAVDVPVLRKDFIVTERQLDETVLLGADAVLLIQRLLSPAQLADLVGHARELGLDVLLELFVDEDPEPAVASGAAILGVNARNLATFEVRLDLVEAMAAALPADRVRVAESGITGTADVRRLAAAGYDAFLVGEHLVRAEDPAIAVRELRGEGAGHGVGSGHESGHRASGIAHPESSDRRPATSDDPVRNGNGNGSGWC